MRSSIVFTHISYSLHLHSSTSIYWAPTVCQSLGLALREHMKSTPCPHKNLGHWRDWQTNTGCGPTAFYIMREAAHSTPFAFQTVSWRHSSSEEWLLISSKGFLLRGKYFKFALADYWPVCIVFPSTGIPVSEVVIDHNQTN